MQSPADRMTVGEHSAHSTSACAHPGGAVGGGGSVPLKRKREEAMDSDGDKSDGELQVQCVPSVDQCVCVHMCV